MWWVWAAFPCALAGFGERGLPSVYAKSILIPLRIASALVKPCALQYSSSAFAVSWSSLTLTPSDLGFSAFGLPVRGDKFFTSLSGVQKIIYFLVSKKSTPFSGKSMRRPPPSTRIRGGALLFGAWNQAWSSGVLMFQASMAFWIMRSLALSFSGFSPLLKVLPWPPQPRHLTRV